jgi:hypothetical protein
MLAQVFKLVNIKSGKQKKECSERNITLSQPRSTFFVNYQFFSFLTCGQSCGQSCGQNFKDVVKVVVKFRKDVVKVVVKVVILSNSFCSAILFSMRTKFFIKNFGKGLKKYELIKR